MEIFISSEEITGQIRKTDDPRYLLWMGGSLLLCFLLYGIFGRKTEKKPALAALGPVMSAVCGVACAKLFYCLVKIQTSMTEGLWSVLTDLSPERFSFFGGMAGVCFGIALSARILGVKPVKALDHLAPYVLLFAALARFGEHFLGTLGLNSLTEPEMEEGVRTFLMLPAVGTAYYDEGEIWWTEWWMAVYVFEGIAMLFAALISGFGFREHRFLRSVFWFCLPQILLESLRGNYIAWNAVVRVEQICCAVGMTAVLVLYAVKMKKGFSRFIPVIIMLVCAGIFIVCEFAKEGKIAALKELLDVGACYLIMAAGLALLAGTEIYAFRGVLRRENDGQKTDARL